MSTCLECENITLSLSVELLALCVQRISVYDGGTSHGGLDE